MEEGEGKGWERCRRRGEKGRSSENATSEGGDEVECRETQAPHSCDAPMHLEWSSIVHRCNGNPCIHH